MQEHFVVTITNDFAKTETRFSEDLSRRSWEGAASLAAWLETFHKKQKGKGGHASDEST